MLGRDGGIVDEILQFVREERQGLLERSIVHCDENSIIDCNSIDIFTSSSTVEISSVSVNSLGQGKEVHVTHVFEKLLDDKSVIDLRKGSILH